MKMVDYCLFLMMESSKIVVEQKVLHVEQTKVMTMINKLKYKLKKKLH